MNPGGAISTVSTPSGSVMWLASTSAMRSGAVRASGASCMAALEAKSPCSGRAGCSMRTAGGAASPSARSPAAVAAERAAATAVRSCSRRVGMGPAVYPTRGPDHGLLSEFGGGRARGEAVGPRPRQ